MKKILFSALLLVSSLANAKLYTFLADKAGGEVSVSNASNSGQEGIDLQFHISSMETDDVVALAPFKSMQKMKFSGLSTTEKVGVPSLPFHSVVVAEKPENIIIKSDLGEEIALDEVTPAPSPKLPLRNEEYKEDYSALNWVNVSRSASKLYEKEYMGDFRGLPLTKITFYPVQYSAVKGLKVFPTADFKIFSKKSSTLENITEPEVMTALAGINNKYVIVTPSKFVPALATFIDWKKAQGYEIEVFNLEDVGPTADKVKAFLQTRYADAATKFSWALLVGNENIFPTFYRSTSSSSRTPSDLPYFTMDGASDFIADVFYGRFVVSTDADIINQTKKIMTYEKGTFADMSGFARGIAIASNEGSAPSDVDYVKMMAKPFEDNLSTVFTYHLQGNNTATVKKISDALNVGVMWVNYVGHGSGYAWASTNDNFNTAAIKNLKTAGMVKPVIIDVACMNGKFSTGYFGERWMNEVSAAGEPIGATTYYGGSVNVSWHPPAIMAKGINIKVIEEKVQTIGEAVFAGQMYLNTNYTGAKKDVTDNMTWYHLFGDPTMKLRLK